MSQNNSTDTVEVKREYYGSGALRDETPYKNRERNGIAKYYYESGTPRWVIPYVMTKNME